MCSAHMPNRTSTESLRMREGAMRTRKLKMTATATTTAASE